MRLILALRLVMFGAMVTKRHLKLLKDLGIKKSREEQGRFLIEGLRMIEEAAESDFELQEVLFTESFAGSDPGRSVLEKLRRKGPVLTVITGRDIKAISDTVTAQGIVAVVSARRFDFEAMVQPGKRSLLVGFDAVADPGNLGSMIRTCDWFGVNGMVIGQDSVELYNPKVLRSTMGGIFHLPIVENVNLPTVIGRLKSSGYTVYVADASGEVYAEDVRYADRAFIILGNEARGAAPSLKHSADVRVAIRRYGLSESLNVGVACGVLLSVLRMASAAGGRYVVHP
jgi:TrmH family RNA methyltransferase